MVKVKGRNEALCVVVEVDVVGLSLIVFTIGEIIKIALDLCKDSTWGHHLIDPLELKMDLWVLSYVLSDQAVEDAVFNQE